VVANRGGVIRRGKFISGTVNSIHDEVDLFRRDFVAYRAEIIITDKEIAFQYQGGLRVILIRVSESR
jgi:hypothetical protein